MSGVGGSSLTIVIAGLGPAGLAAAEQARATAPAARIVAVSEEALPAYYRPQLSHRLATGMDAESLLIRKRDWYERNRIDLMLGRRVKRLDTADRFVELSNGDSMRYDTCVLATGSSSFLPPVKGNDLGGVFTLRSIADAEAIRTALRESRMPVVIGGGPLGLEAAWAIASTGARVTVLERGDRLLKRQLDDEGSAHLHSLLEKAGISPIYGADTEEITGEGRVEGIKLKGPRSLEADFVLFSAGVRPNTAPARQSGLQVNNGVVVDERMRTSDPSVYAAGDVAEYGGRAPAVMAVAVAQGKVAGANAAGGDARYVEPELTMVINILGAAVASVGELAGDFIVAARPDEGYYLKVFFRGETPVGAAYIGDARRLPTLRQAIAGRRRTPGASTLGSASELLSTWSSSR